MANVNLLFECLEWTKQILTMNQEIVFDIKVGDFKFAFNSRKTNVMKHRSPSQLKRNTERQNEYRRKCTKLEPKIEESESSVNDVIVEQEIVEKEIQDIVKYHHDQETQTLLESEEVGTQTENDEFHLVRKEVQIDKNGNITVDKDETIIELKFYHGMDSWNQINQHVRDTLKMKMKSKAWLANSGPHFKIIAFVMDKAEYEKWKFETLIWENISKSTRVSRIYK